MLLSQTLSFSSMNSSDRPNESLIPGAKLLEDFPDFGQCVHLGLDVLPFLCYRLLCLPAVITHLHHLLRKLPNRHLHPSLEAFVDLILLLLILLNAVAQLLQGLVILCFLV